MEVVRPHCAWAMSLGKWLTGARLLLQTIAKANGLIKGRVGNPACDLPLREDGKLAVGSAVGAGEHSVIWYLPTICALFSGFCGYSCQCILYAHIQSL